MKYTERSLHRQRGQSGCTNWFLLPRVRDACSMGSFLRGIWEKGRWGGWPERKYVRKCSKGAPLGAEEGAMLEHGLVCGVSLGKLLKTPPYSMVGVSSPPHGEKCNSGAGESTKGFYTICDWGLLLSGRGKVVGPFPFTWHERPSSFRSVLCIVRSDCYAERPNFQSEEATCREQIYTKHHFQTIVYYPTSRIILGLSCKREQRGGSLRN